MAIVSEPQSLAERAADDGSGLITEVELGPIGSHIDSWNGDREVMPLTIDEHTGRSDPIPLHALSWKDESHPQWVRIRTVMVSGAAESVAPPSMAPGVVMEESPGSQRGQHYISASAGRLPNMGQQRLQVKTNEARDSKVLYQIAEVSRPLTAVSGTCDAGNCVVFTSEGGFIMNCQTGGHTYFQRNGGIYELDLGEGGRFEQCRKPA